ncbi:NGCA protein, partial [Tachuris rubrigastra]|nr:NGCA protein [Tachuris rubrigastra]
PPVTPPHPPGVLWVGGEASGAVLGGLHPWSRYRLQVLAVNGRGAGPPSADIRFHTPEG